MQFSFEKVTALATIAGTVIAAFALVQSSGWLAAICLCFVLIALGAALYARQKRLLLNSASVVIEGHSIDSLNVANLRRLVNRTFTVQEAHHSVRIAGEDLEITWRYSGYCKANRATAIEFSIDADQSTSFDQLDCIAFDLRRDPNMSNKIRPVLIGTDGISKKISVPFLEPLQSQEPFSIQLSCQLPRCLKAGFGYYTSTSSLIQERVQRCEVHLTFIGAAPRWVRVYEGSTKRPHELVKSLGASREEPGQHEYVDVVDERPGQSARIYAFWRESL